METYYAVIKQEKTKLILESCDIPYSFSSNIPILLKRDEVNFPNHILVPFYVVSDRPYLDQRLISQGVPLVYSYESNLINLPAEALKGKYCYLSVAMKSNLDNSVVYCSPVRFTIRPTPGTSNDHYISTDWLDAILAFVDNYLISQDNPFVPVIGENGNWFIQGNDTNKPSRGEDGKSAYEIAVENGYTGTEEEWLASLGSNIQTMTEEEFLKLWNDIIGSSGGTLPPEGSGDEDLEYMTEDDLNEVWEEIFN